MIDSIPSKFQTLLLFCAFFVCATFHSSCVKEMVHEPIMKIISDTGYQYISDSFLMNSTIKIGISASQFSANDPLDKFSFSHGVNGNKDTVLFSKTLVGTEKTNYNFSVNKRLGNLSKSKEQFYFTLLSKKGRILQLSYTAFIKYHK